MTWRKRRTAGKYNGGKTCYCDETKPGASVWRGGRSSRAIVSPRPVFLRLLKIVHLSRPSDTLVFRDSSDASCCIILHPVPGRVGTTRSRLESMARTTSADWVQCARRIDVNAFDTWITVQLLQCNTPTTERSKSEYITIRIWVCDRTYAYTYARTSVFEILNLPKTPSGYTVVPWKPHATQMRRFYSFRSCTLFIQVT